MQGKTGKGFVKGDLWSTRTAKPGSDLLQEIAMAYRGSSIGQLCTKYTRRGSPARRTGLPAGLILKGAHITEETVKEHETHISILSPLPHPEFFISFENKVISHVGESSFIYSPSKKSPSFLNTARVCCHGNDHYTVNRHQPSREETAGVNEPLNELKYLLSWIPY